MSLPTTVPNRQCSPHKLHLNGQASKNRERTQQHRCACCRVRYKTSRALRAHQTSTGHCYCQTCDLVFPDTSQHITHVRKVPHDKQYQCCDCKREYVDQNSLTTHCCVCDRVYKKEADLAQHVTSSKTHVARARASGFQPHSADRYPCPECRMAFQDRNMLTKHMKSKHKPKRTLNCPIGKKCRKKFASASALLNHLESGGCKSGMNRGKLNQLIIRHDKNHYITCVDATKIVDLLQRTEPASPGTSTFSWENVTDYDPRTVLTPSSQSTHESHFTPFNYSVPSSDVGDEESVGGVLLTPSSRDSPSEWLSVRSPHVWPDDGISEVDQSDPLSRQLRCPLCPPELRSFSNVRAFQMHMDSPVHAPKIFHCPMAFVSNSSGSNRLKQEKSFTTLSGLTQHLEVGVCRGGIKTFWKAIKYVEERLLQLEFSGVKLLVEPKEG